MKGYLETLETLEELPESAHKMIRTITGSTNRLSVFAEDMLIIARLESGQEYASANEDCNLTEIIRRICDDAEPLANEKQLEFVKELPDTSCTIQGSPPHMRAALWNVLDNALKFTKEGRVVLRLRAEAGKAIITVEDTGVGVSAEEQPKLFTKFHRGTDIMEYNYEGTGIGLYLTKLIVENHKGTITVTSAENKGTTVTITLPLTQS
jgi:signal transduction histidine kinase